MKTFTKDSYKIKLYYQFEKIISINNTGRKQINADELRSRI